MWVVASSESSVVVLTGSMSIGLNLLDNEIDSFISVFCLVWIFPFLCLGFFFPDFGCVSHIRLELLKCVP